MQEDRVVRRAEMEKLVGLTERQVRGLEEQGRFPKPRRAVGMAYSLQRHRNPRTT